MTGMEAWNLIAPLLAAFLDLTRDEGRQAYLTAYWALKEYDEKRKEKRGA